MDNIIKQFLVLLCFTSSYVYGQSTYTISGTITDDETGEVLIGATVYIPENYLGAVSNSYGFYSITVPAKSRSLICSYLGYESEEFILDLNQNITLNIRLKADQTQWI